MHLLLHSPHRLCCLCRLCRSFRSFRPFCSFRSFRPFCSFLSFRAFYPFCPFCPFCPACPASWESDLILTMPDQPSGKREALKRMRHNLTRLYGTESEQCHTKHRKNIRRRCLHIREHLSADGQIRWAQTSIPKSWPRSDWNDFTDSVWKIKKQNRERLPWLPEVIESLEKLSETQFQHSGDFKDLYKRGY
jgi:hypothetical protein